MRRILITGGAPRIPIDAVRHLAVHATGATAMGLAERLDGLGVDLLLSIDAAPGQAWNRYRDRAELEQHLATWLADHPDGVVVMSAAINDYQFEHLEHERDGQRARLPAGSKLPSGADHVTIHLIPDSKLVDRLGPEFGHQGPLIAFKYEAADTVLTSAAKLRDRVSAALVVANSIDGSVQALVGDEIWQAADRTELLDELAQRIRPLANS